MQDQTFNTRVERFSSHADDSGILTDLLYLSSSSMLERIRQAPTQTIESNLFYILNLYETKIQKLLNNIKDNVEETKRIEEDLKQYSKIICNYYLVLSERFYSNGLTDNRKYTYEEEEFMFNTLDSFYYSILYFSCESSLKNIFNLLESIHLPLKDSTKFSLFDSSLFQKYYSKFEIIDSNLSKKIKVKISKIYRRFLQLLDEEKIAFPHKFLIINLIKLQKRGFIKYCFQTPNEEKKLFIFLNKVVDKFSITSEIKFKLDYNTSYLTRLGKYCNFVLINSQKEIKINEKVASIDNDLYRLFEAALGLIKILIDTDARFGYDTAVFDDIVELFKKVSFLHIRFKGKEASNLHSKFIISVSFPLIRELSHIFSLDRYEPNTTVTNKKTCFSKLKYSLINYSSFLLGYIIKHDNYFSLQQAILMGDKYSFKYFLLLCSLFEIFKNLNIKSLNLQERIILFEICLIYLRIYFQFNDPHYTNLKEMKHQYYSIFLDFYDQLGQIDYNHIKKSLLMFSSDSESFFKNIMWIFNNLLESRDKESPVNYKPTLYKGKEDIFIYNYNILPILCTSTLVLFSKNYHNTSPRYIADNLKLIKKLINVKEILDLFSINYREYFAEVCMKAYKVVYSNCTRDGEFSTTFQELNVNTLNILSLSCEILRILMHSAPLNNFVESLNYTKLFTSYKLIESYPSEYNINSINPIFSLFQEMFENHSFKFNMPKKEVVQHFIYLFGHSFMLWAEHPRIIPSLSTTNYINSIAPSEQSLISYSNYGFKLISKLIHLLKCFEKHEDWLEVFTCLPFDENYIYPIQELAKPGLFRLIRIPGYLMPTAKLPTFSYKSSGNEVKLINNNKKEVDSVISIINPLYRTMLCYKHDTELAHLIVSNILQFIDVGDFSRYVLSNTDFIGSFAYETTRTFFTEPHVCNGLNHIISRFLTNLKFLRIIILRDLFGEWYRNILKLPDYANHNKATEPAKLTSFISKELIKIYEPIEEIYLKSKNESNSRKLCQYSSVALCYCSLAHDPLVAFMVLEQIDLDSSDFEDVDWLINDCPYGELLRMLFNHYNVLELCNAGWDEDSVQKYKQPDLNLTKSAAYAIHFHAFLKTTYMRRKLKSTLKEVISSQHSFIEPLLETFQNSFEISEKDEITFKSDGPDNSHGEFKVPRHIVKSMSKIFSVILENGGIESESNEISLPYHLFKSLEYLNTRMRVLTHRRVKKSSSKVEYHFIGDQHKIHQPRKLKQLFELADMYDIEFLRLYCFGTFLRQLLTAIRSSCPHKALFNLYELYEENGDFPLFQKSPELCKFLCHLIALYIDGFLKSPDEEIDEHDNEQKQPTKVKNGNLSSDIDTEDEIIEEQIEEKNTDNNVDTKNDYSEDLMFKKLPLIYRLNPHLLAKWWSQVYFKPKS